VPNVNTIPGREVVDFDCRVLPSVSLESVEAVIDEEIRRAQERSGARIVRSPLQRIQAPAPTSPSAPVALRLREAVEEVLGVKVTVGGVGGGTCAAHFRAEGLPAAVWAKENDMAHMPNEYVEIADLVAEAKVFARRRAGDGAR
jgi:succinyl-diaminopimelate desuccinylase